MGRAKKGHTPRTSAKGCNTQRGKAMTQQRQGRAQNVVHARVGREAYESLQAWADRQGCSLTQALRTLLADLRQRELEEGSATRLESISRSLVVIQ